MSGKNQEVPVDQAAQPGIKNPDVFFCDLRTLPVDGRLCIRHDLHIDSAHAIFDVDEIILHAGSVKKTFDLRTREAGRKSQSGILEAEVLKRNGYIDAFPSRIYLFGSGSVDNACTERINADDIVKSRAEGNSIDHSKFSSINDRLLLTVSVRMPVPPSKLLRPSDSYFRRVSGSFSVYEETSVSSSSFIVLPK